MRRADCAAWAFAALVLSACAQVELQQPAENLEFELAGRLAVRHAKDSFSGSLTWRHAPTSDEMLLSTPLGQGVARILREGDAVTLSTAEPREYRAADAESLTEQVLGFRLPLTGLADWVQARPAKNSPAVADTAPDGRLRALEQNGWKVEYLAYAGERPSRLRLTYPGIELTLLITQWK
jgi:outer membrane lipoprotein LolB